MFVKAGIVVSAAAATLLAVSPLAFAGDYDHSDKKSHHKSSKDDHDDDKNDDDGDHKRHRGHRGGNDGDCDGNVNQVNNGDSSGLINISHVNAAVPVNVCDVDILSGVLGVLSSDLTNNDND